MRLVGSAKEAQEGLLGSNGWGLKFWRDSSAAKGFAWEVWGPNYKLASPDYITKTRKATQIPSSYEKQQHFCIPGKDGWRFREPLKANTQNFICSHLPWALAEGGQSGLETREESLGLVALRSIGITARIPVQSHSPYCRIHLSQAEHFPLSGISLRGSNSPTHRNYSAPLYGA